MERRLAAIVSIDVAGYSRLMGRDEAGTLAALKAHRVELIDPQAASNGGRTIKLMGDGALMEFVSAVDAVRFAVAVQCAMKGRNAGLPEDRRVAFRIGINLGDVIVDGDDIYGDGVNVAARLEGLAEPGGVCIRRNVRNQVRDKLALDFVDLGDVEVKNIERAVRAFQVVLNEKAEALAATPASRPAKPSSRPWQAAAGIALSLLVIAGLAWWQPWATEFEPVAPETMAQPLPDNPSIAVLPLDDLSSGSDKGYLSDAISEGIITELSRFPELFVIARNSSFHYRDKATDVREIARELGVRYVLEGSQQKAGQKLRVTVQLIDAVAGNHVWAQTLDRDLADIFMMQDEITRAVAAQVGAKLIEEAKDEATRADPARLNAFQNWLRGERYLYQFTRETNEQARRAFQDAIATDPDMARAHAGLAWADISAYRWNWTDDDRDALLASAQKEAQTAVNLAPRDYATHQVMAYVLMQAGEIDASIVKLRESLQLNPNAADIRASLAEALAYVGNIQESINAMQEAIRLDPHHPDWYNWVLGWDQWYVGDCQEGLASITRMRQLPNLARRTLASLHVCLGQMEEARAVMAEFLNQEPGYTVGDVRLSLAQKYKNSADMERWIDDLRKAGLPD